MIETKPIKSPSWLMREQKYHLNYFKGKKGDFDSVEEDDQEGSQFVHVPTPRIVFTRSTVYTLVTPIACHRDIFYQRLKGAKEVKRA